MLDTWPYACDPDTGTVTQPAGTKLYCASGSPDQVYGDIKLDGLQYVGTARVVTASSGAYGITSGFNVSPSSSSLTGVPFSGAAIASRVTVTIPAQCRPFNLVVGADLQGIGNNTPITHRVGLWIWPSINSVVQYAQTPLWESTRWTVGGVPGMTASIRQQIFASYNPETIATIGAGVSTTVDCEIGMYFGVGSADANQNTEGMTGALRTYIQFV